MARYRSKSRRSSRGRRRNPASGQLRDGTSVSISGNSVTLTTPYGETYEFDEVSPSGLRALSSARNFSAAQKACNRSGILRAINPKRGSRRKGRGRRDKSKSRSSRRSAGKRRGRGRTKARRSYSRKGTRGRRGGRWTERRARKKARFYQGRFKRSHSRSRR